MAEAPRKSPGGLNVPGPNPEWLKSKDWETDVAAHFEEEHFPAVGDLPGAIHKNKIAVHRVLGFCVPASIVLAFILFWLALLVYLWHVLAAGPHWLSTNELDHLKTLLFSGAVGALVSQGARHYLKGADEADKSTTTRG